MVSDAEQRYGEDLIGGKGRGRPWGVEGEWGRSRVSGKLREFEIQVQSYSGWSGEKTREREYLDGSILCCHFLFYCVFKGRGSE